MTEKLNIAIFGVGAMGCLFGSRLQQMGKEIHLFGHWPEQIQVLQRKGLDWRDLQGQSSSHCLTVTADLGDLPALDLIILLVKSHQTRQAAKEMAQVANIETVILSLQNGLGNQACLEEFFHKDQVVLGVTAQGATLIKAGVVRHGGNGKTFLQQSIQHKKVINNAAFLLNRAGIETEVIEQVEPMLWEKLMANAAINPLTALLEISNGQLLNDDLVRRVMIGAANEVEQLALAQNIALTSKTEEQVSRICQKTAANHSSMLQDMQRGSLTEIDAICGTVVNLGTELKIATPINAFLLEHVKAKENGIAFSPSLFQHLF